MKFIMHTPLTTLPFGPRTIILTAILTFIAVLPMAAQNDKGKTVTYKTYIYTSDELGSEISKLNDQRDSSRGYLGDLFSAAGHSVKGLAGGYVTSFFDMGVNAIGSLITRNRRLKKEWEEAVKKENVFQTRISTVSEMSDFYDAPSFDGAMDPKGMRFDGIGCLRMDGNDTLFYVSLHIDRTKLYRIINHSKFELVLDTLILSPKRSNLPNTQLSIPYSFEERKDFTLSMDITISSSWMNEVVQLQKNVELGQFNINIPVDPSLLGADGFLRYTRQADAAPRYKVTGECFIVPRSYMGFRDEKENFKDSWGTGEYKLSIDLKESCDVTEQYRANWKADYKHRKEMTKKNLSLLERTWQVVSKQDWNEITHSWVITTLQAPADIISNDFINKLGLE